MSIKAKILALVLAFGLLAAAITALGLKTMSDYKAIITDYRHASEAAYKGERLNRLLLSSAVEMRGIYLAKSREEVLFQADRVIDRSRTLEKFLNDWQASLKPGELPQFKQVMTDCLVIVRGGYTIAGVARNEGQAAADARGNKDKYRVLREQRQVRIDAMVADITRNMRAKQQAVEAYEQNRIRDFVLIAGGGTLALLGASLWVAISSITSPLNRVRQSIIRISEGAYDTMVPKDTPDDEIGQIWGAVAILKDRAAEADRLTKEKLEEEHRLRELVLD